MKAEDIRTLSDEDIGRHFSGAFGQVKLKEAVALIRSMAERCAPPSGKADTQPPRPFDAA